MKILFCSYNPLDRKLGAPKVIIEASEALSRLGATTQLVSDEDISPGIRKLSGLRKTRKYAEDLKKFLLKEAPNFDVVDYEHRYLPFDRKLFNPKTLFVARSVMLYQHLERIRIPKFKNARALGGKILKEPFRQFDQFMTIRYSDKTCRNADLVNVSNSHDLIELKRRGISEEKVVVIPFGLTEERVKEFEVAKTQAPNFPRVAFVGTFDTRKGAVDLPDIIRTVSDKIPTVKFRLMGARYRTPSELLTYLPSELHRFVEITQEFEPENLPKLLSECSVGIYPSYLEGFPFGVLEMLAAALPVFAFDAPGAPMMVRKENLAPPGEGLVLGIKIARLLGNKDELAKARINAKERSKDFPWHKAAQTTLDTYSKFLAKIKT